MVLLPQGPCKGNFPFILMISVANSVIAPGVKNSIFFYVLPYTGGLNHLFRLIIFSYTILVMYMLDSDQEPSYNLSKNLLLLPRILKLIVDMVDDSTPCYIAFPFQLEYIYLLV